MPKMFPDTDRSAGIAIIDCHCTNILLVKEKASSKWGLPKGHLKKYENAWRGALRELAEETGLKLRRNTYFWKRRPFRLDNNLLYIIQLKDEYHTFKPDIFEISEVQWRPIYKLRYDSRKKPDQYNMWVRLVFRAGVR